MKYIYIGVSIAILAAALLFFFEPVVTEEYAGSYAYPASSSDECYEDEIFDEDEQLCVYVEYEQDEDGVYVVDAESELETWGDEYEKSGGVKSDERPVAWDDYGDEENDMLESSASSEESELNTTYRVLPGEKLDLVSGTAGATDTMIWQQIAALSPNTFSNKYIEQYGVFDNPDDETLAYVHDEDGNGRWIIAVNAAGYQSSTPRERATTLVHELGHIVTLNEDQVPAGEETSCSGFFTGEGCAHASSYVAGFVRQFWTQEDLRLVGGGAGEGDESLFSRKPNSFVTEYAATNPGEDIAESFALFILDQQKTATSIAEEKVQFFYNYPELATFRADMRQALVQGIVRARKTQTE